MRKISAFTLIEILVVIALLAILTVLAIANYGAARRNAKLDIATDTLISVLQQQQGLAKSGRGLQQSAPTITGQNLKVNKPLCYGVYFTKVAPYVQLITAPYIGVDTSIDATRSDFCNMASGAMQLTAFNPDQMENIKVGKIVKFGNAALDTKNLAIVFKPPMGKPVIGELNDLQNVNEPSNPVITITVSSLDGTGSRSFSFDLASGTGQALPQP